VADEKAVLARMRGALQAVGFLDGFVAHPATPVVCAARGRNSRRPRSRF
jgi:hypothetical protein